MDLAVHGRGAHATILNQANVSEMRSSAAEALNPLLPSGEIIRGTGKDERI